MEVLKKASVEQNIEPFAKFLARPCKLGVTWEACGKNLVIDPNEHFKLSK
jgi:hypothetical protein